MEREYKALSFTNIKSGASGRVRTGIAAVFGNIDSDGDRMMPGAFAKSITEGQKRVKHLWNHSWEHPPIAAIKELREIGRDELPPEVLAKSPEATGGLVVKREYYKSDLANWILEAIDAEDVNEMSFGFNVIKSQNVTEPVSSDVPDQTREVRNIEEVRLFDTSDVLWGANAATVAIGAKHAGAILPLGVIASNLAMLASEIKSGARNAAADQKLLDLIHETILSLGAKCESKQETPESNDEGKADEHEAEAAEPVKSDGTSLEFLKLKQQRLAIEADFTYSTLTKSQTE